MLGDRRNACEYILHTMVELGDEQALMVFGLSAFGHINVDTRHPLGATAVVIVSSLISRIEKLEADLRKARANLVEFGAAHSRLSTGIDAAEPSIKSLRADLHRPRVRLLTSILDSETRLRGR